ncbi:hypothetical protein [Helicobacter sp. 16-1353]|uniref:hypothetical protein n=1 Tax=Helicobacter sp. 16-1353 TaxID=2004996 RepID=UPI0015EEEFD9|nr:hypothetical protein [Helicobacter sp. 16-1353]
MDTASQNFTQIKSFYYFSQYYRKAGYSDLSEYFANLSGAIFLNLPDYSITSNRLKLKIVFPRFHKLLKQCKKITTKLIQSIRLGRLDNQKST